MLFSEICGKLMLPIYTLRASGRRREPPQSAQGRLLMFFANSSRTDMDSVSL